MYPAWRVILDPLVRIEVTGLYGGTSTAIQAAHPKGAAIPASLVHAVVAVLATRLEASEPEMSAPSRLPELAEVN